MKRKLQLKSILLTAMLCMGMSAWADATNYDFEDSNVRFTAYNSAKITVAIQENSGPNSNSKAVKFAYKQKGAHNFAYLDFSSLVEEASMVNVEFDFYVTTASGHNLITLADADYHTGANAGFNSDSNTGYGSEGAIFNLGCYRANSANDFAINSSKKTTLTSTCLGNWCHANITVNNVNKTVSYAITRCDATELDASASASDVAFMNGSANKCTQIDVYMGATSADVPIYIDNLVITPTVIATNHSYTINAVGSGNTLKRLGTGIVAEGSSYGVYVPYVLEKDGSFYILDNNSTYYKSYTMGNNIEEQTVNYTLDEDVAYFCEYEKLTNSRSYGTQTSNSSYSSGGGYGLYSGANSYTGVISTTEAGYYDLQLAVVARNTNKTDKFTVKAKNGDTYEGEYSFSHSSNTGVYTLKNVYIPAGYSLYMVDAAKANSNAYYDYIILRRSKLPVTITEAGWATFSSTYALDFEHATPSGLSAYMVTGTSGREEGSTITLSDAVTNVPGNTGLLLNGAAGDYTIPVLASSETSTTGNLMQACVTETTVYYNDNNSYNYVLSTNDQGKAEFQQIVSGEHSSATVGAGKAYLSLNAPAAPTLFLSFDNENTGISATLKNNEEIKNKAIFNLNGQRVATPSKGLYIINGKKVVIK